MQHWKLSLLISLEQLVALTTMGFVWIILTITISVTQERIVETPAGVTGYLTRLTLYRGETKLLCQRNCWIRMKNLLGKNDIKYQMDGDGRYRNWCDTFDRLKFTKLSKVKLFLPLISWGSCASLYPMQTEESFTSGNEEQSRFLGHGFVNISQKTKQFFLYSSNKTVY